MNIDAISQIPLMSIPPHKRPVVEQELPHLREQLEILLRYACRRDLCDQVLPTSDVYEVINELWQVDASLKHAREMVAYQGNRTKTIGTAARTAMRLLDRRLRNIFSQSPETLQLLCVPQIGRPAPGQGPQSRPSQSQKDIQGRWCHTVDTLKARQDLFAQICVDSYTSQQFEDTWTLVNMYGRQFRERPHLEQDLKDTIQWRNETIARARVLIKEGTMALRHNAAAKPNELDLLAEASIKHDRRFLGKHTAKSVRAKVMRRKRRTQARHDAEQKRRQAQSQFLASLDIPEKASGHHEPDQVSTPKTAQDSS